MFFNFLPDPLKYTLIFWSAVSCLLLPSLARSGQDHAAQVLVIQSYHPGYVWADNITSAIKAEFDDSAPEADLYLEYMDTKRHDPEKIFPFLAALYAKKLSQNSFDVVIASDNNALRFIIRYREELFPDTPIVFCGVNSFDPSFLGGRKAITGIAEDSDLRKTISLILNAHPTVKQIAVITDVSESGKMGFREFKKIAPHFQGRVGFVELTGLTASELKNAMKILPDDSAVLYLSFLRDPTGAVFGIEEGVRLVAERGLPIYSCWDMYLGCGIVGGIITSGKAHGEMAAKMAIRILRGESADSIPICYKSPNVPMFDERQLDRFHISKSALPPKSILINRTFSFYDTYKHFVWSILSVVIGMGAVIFLLVGNIIKRRNAERALRAQKAALRASEAQLSNAMEIAKLGYWEYDVASNLFIFNDYFYAIFRTTAKEVGGYTMLPKSYAERFIPPEERSIVIREMQKTLERTDTNYSRDFEHSIVYADGEPGYIAVRSFVMKDEQGRTVKVYGANQDVTDRKMAEQEKEALEGRLQRAEKMEAIGTLAGGVAHDLNNVLSGLVSYPDLLLIDLPDDSPLRNAVLTIQDSGKKAAAIVQDLLTLARRGVAISKVTNLNDVIVDYLNSPEYAKLKSFSPKAHLRTDLAGDLLNIIGSPVHLSKTVMNLVSNAVEALHRDGVVTISTRNQYVDMPLKGYDEVHEGDYAVLSVEDNGQGIAEHDMQKIFEPFYTKKAMGRSGTGLGMAVVWGTVKDHNGYINVESMRGKGSRFSLYFPITRKETDKRRSQSMDAYAGNGERILVVDDVPQQREIAALLLKKLGYRVDVVSSGEEAVEYMRRESADLVILDMIMAPGMDGLETYKEIVALHPGQKAIIASGFSETERVKAAQRMGAGRYVKKPYTLEKIGLAVRDELAR